MKWLYFIFSAQAAFANHTSSPVFKDDLIYENSADVLFSTHAKTPFLYKKAKYQDFVDIFNTTNIPSQKIIINLFTAESDPLPSEAFENGKAVLIKKGTQWKVASTELDTVVFETLRQNPKHTLMCRVLVLNRSLFSILEVGDMNECAKALHLKLRKTDLGKNTYIIE